MTSEIGIDGRAFRATGTGALCCVLRSLRALTSEGIALGAMCARHGTKGRKGRKGGDEVETRHEGTRGRGKWRRTGHSRSAALACHRVVIRAIHVLETDARELGRGEERGGSEVEGRKGTPWGSVIKRAPLLNRYRTSATSDGNAPFYLSIPPPTSGLFHFHSLCRFEGCSRARIP